MDIKHVLMELSKVSGVAGYEGLIADKLQSELMQYSDNIQMSVLGNISASICNAKPGFPHIVLEAHMDEIGFVVTSLEQGGFVRIAACGGIDSKILLAQELMILGKEPVLGVVCSKPPHLQTVDEQKQAPKMDEIFVDTGYSLEQLKTLVNVGDRIVFCAEPKSLGDTRITGKALDNRAGVAVVLLALELLKSKNYSCGLSVLFSTQEEVSGKGATTGGFTLCPDIALCVDVSFALAPNCPKEKCANLGEGVMIGMSPTLDSEISRQLCEIAQKNHIPFQIEVMGGETSTDSDKLSVSGKGVRVGLCSIPERNMHTAVEVVDIRDIKAAAKLMADYILSVGNGGAL